MLPVLRRVLTIIFDRKEVSDMAFRRRRRFGRRPMRRRRGMRRGVRRTRIGVRF